MKITFKIDGTPKGKARARTVCKNGRTWSYTPKGTQDYENNVKKSFLDEFSLSLEEIIEKPVKVSIIAFFEPNKSLSNKKKEQLYNQYYLKKPDADNIAKSICDALNGLAYKDDSQIYDLSVKKFYASSSYVVVTIEYLQEG